MKFSLLIEVQVSEPRPETERRAFHDAVEQAVLADALGYHSVWAVEHHGLLEYSHCSAPEVLLAFIAARTRRIRLGHAVTLTPHRYNHPLRVAERIATLDILSEGRVSWGSGKSASRTEQGAFEIDPEELDSQWSEALEMIPRMWGSDVFEWEGRHFKIPPISVIPKPVQKPHPPIFVACSRLETVERAGRLGVGSLNFAGGTEISLREKVEAYRKAIATARAGTGGHRVNEHFCSTPTALVLEDDRAACAHGFRGSRFFGDGLGTYFYSPYRVVGGLDVPRDALSGDELERLRAGRGRAEGPLNAIVGDPSAARESVGRFASSGVDELILVMQMGTVPQDVVMQSIRTFGEKVLPHYA